MLLLPKLDWAFSCFPIQEKKWREVAECYCRHDGVIELACKNSLIDPDGRGSNPGKDSRGSHSWGQKGPKKQFPFSTLPQGSMRQLGGRPLRLCNLVFFACGPLYTPCKDEIPVHLCAGSSHVGLCCYEHPFHPVHRFFYLNTKS